MPNEEWESYETWDEDPEYEPDDPDEWRDMGDE
jgi:hypothetical protein